MVRREIWDVLLSTQKQKMLSYGAFIGCIIMAVKLYTVMKTYPLPVIYFHEENTNRNTSKISSSSRSDQMESRNPVNIISKFSNVRSDVYELNGDVRIQGISSTIFIATQEHNKSNSTSLDVKPYPRKNNLGAVGGVRSFKIITQAASANKTPHCSRQPSNIPAILFSAGGLARNNYFHTFADVLVPLFLTSHQFNGTAIFLVTDYNSTWTSKYGAVMEKLSKYDIRDIDNENEVLCFSRMIIGLEAYRDLEIVPSESKHFSRKNLIGLLELQTDLLSARHRPRMLIISRKQNRRLMNERETGNMARSLGFDVVVSEMPWNVSSNAELANSVDVMVGVHGAGLTNLVFLRENAVLIQIVPFGLEYYAWLCFEGAVESSGFKYLRYNVSINESSLLGKYPPNSTIYTNPAAISNDFFYFSSVYLDNQDVILDLNRFGKTLSKALELLPNF